MGLSLGSAAGSNIPSASDIAGAIRSAPLVSRSPISYYATAEGGRTAFNLSTGIVQVQANTTDGRLAALVNPVGSGEDVYLDTGEFGSSANTTFKRWRGASFAPIANATSIAPINMGGGPATSALRFYIGGTTPQYTATGGQVSKTAHIAAFQQYLTYINGRTVLRPGSVATWTISTPSGLSSGMTASIYFEFWTQPAVA